MTLLRSLYLQNLELAALLIDRFSSNTNTNVQTNRAKTRDRILRVAQTLVYMY